MADKYNNLFAAAIGLIHNTDLYAITISKDTTLYSCPRSLVDAKWREEEEEHKKRIAAMGWLDFMATYLWQMLTKGYKKSELEISAKQKSGRLP
jgi:hypothetical protein